jgi:carboxypeptidase family protein
LVSPIRFTEENGGILKAFSLALMAAALVTACGTSPTDPGSLKDLAILGLQIVGPGEVPPGETARFNLVATLSDRTTRDVTDEANWTSGDGRLASIVAPGQVTGRERGTVLIEASFNGHRGRREVFVLPAGTYRLSGRLNELRYRNVPLVGARVEVTTGAGRGLSATTDRDGVFHLYGVAGDISLQVTKDAYSTVTKTFTVADHQSITIELAHIGNRPDLSGTYRLMIGAADECGIGVGQAKLPEEGRDLIFTAAVSQDGPNVYVTLRTPPSVSNFVQSFSGRIEEARVVFTLRNADDGLPIGLQISASTVLSIEGTAVAAISSTARLEGTASGEIAMRQPPERTLVARCSSEAHLFVLSR